MRKDDWETEDYFNRLLQYNDEEINEVIMTEFGTEVFPPTWTSLHSYQKEGCKWMYRLYQTGVGGILGDEMGLGKTAQLCTHFGSLARDRENRHAIFLIVCPATLLQHWLKEMHRWSPLVRSVILHEISSTGSEVCKRTEKFIEASLKRLQSQEDTKGLAVISTYEGLRHHKESFHRIEWTAVCLDEGQRLKNPVTIVTQVCKGLPCYHRLVLSGTPIQNSLKELWSIFDFIYPGRLGSLTAFEIEFAIPIRAGGYSTASKLEVEIATQTATTLQRIVRPYILRRKKDDMQNIIQLPKKTEQILFCRLSPKQSEIYDSILASHEVQAVLQRRVTAFRAITTLRKLCNHPDLVYKANEIIWHHEPNKISINIVKPALSSSLSKSRNQSITSSRKRQRTEDHELEKESDNLSNDDNNYDSKDDENDSSEDDIDMIRNANWSDSGKLLVLSKILPLWHKQGHKVLIFSQMKGMLNLVSSLLDEFGFTYLRLDGSTPIGKRTGIIQNFNENESIFVMLLTTRTGGLGISLTAANRVLLLDPDWNPMTDIQARERSWRIGQQREVTIYRLISRGTIEEKVYQRQIFKILLSKRVLENPKQKGLFSKTDLKELFERTDDSRTNVYKTSGSTTMVESSVDHDLPVEGEVILRDNSTANDEYFSQVQHQHGLDGIVVDDDDGLGSADEEKMTLEDREIVLAYRQRAKDSEDQGKELKESGEESEDFSIEEVTSSTKQIKPTKNSSSSSSSSSSLLNSKFQPQHNHLKTKIKKNEKSNPIVQDKKLLESLFNGDAITGVYDHNYMEDISSSSSSSSSSLHGRRLSTIENIAARSVQDAVRRVEQSTNYLNNRSHGFISSSSSSSANVLSAIRERQNMSSNINNNSNSTTHTSIREDIDGRLRNVLLQHPTGISSERILTYFPDLGDHHAVLFKQVLKSIATMSNGVWKVNG